jgi:hypothetical protein
MMKRPAPNCSADGRQRLRTGGRQEARKGPTSPVIEIAADTATFSYRLDRNKLRQDLCDNQPHPADRRMHMLDAEPGIV